MSVRSSQSVTKIFTTRSFSTGAATDADSLPTGTLYVNGTADGATVTVTNLATGLYKAEVTCPTLAFGDIVDLRVNATVDSVTDNGVIWQDTKDIDIDSSGEVTPDAATIRAAVGLASADLDTQLSAIDDFLDTEIAAVLDAVDTEIAAILADTNELQTDWADGGRLDMILDERASQTSVDTIDGIVDAIFVDTGTTLAGKIDTIDVIVDAILVDTEELQADWTDGGRLDLILDARASQSSVDDIPTVAEFDARTIVSANYATASALTVVGEYIDTEVAAILAAVDTEVAAIKAKTDQFVFTVANQVDANALSGAGGLDAAGVRAAVGLASANLDTQLSAIDNFLDTEVTAIKDKTDQFVFTIANQVDSNAISGGGSGLDAAGVRAAVGLASANLDTQLSTIDDFLDVEVAAIKAKTDNLPSDPADQSAVEAAITAATASLATAANLATVAGYLDTEIAAILADTNELQTDWVNGGRLDSILDARSSQASVDDLPTNAELAASLATADDATLAAIAALNDITTAEVWADATRTLTAGTNIQLPANGLANVTAWTVAITGNLSGSVGSVTSAITLPTIPANWITADGIATDAFGAIEISSGAGSEIAVAVRAELATELGRIDVASSSLATSAAVATIDDFIDTEVAAILAAVDTEVAAIKAKTDQFVFTVANQVDANALSGGGGLDAAGVRSAVGLASANLDTQIGDLPTNAELATSQAAADDATLAAIAALNNLSQANVRSAVGLASANLDTQLSTIDDLLDTEVAAIKAVTDAIGATGSGLSAVPWNAAWDAEVQSEVNDALVVHRLDELLNADSDIDGGAPPTVGSVFHELLSKTAGSFTFDQSTDSLEAMRDRGDTAWVTATGFSTIDAAGVRSAIGLASANLDTQLADLPTIAEFEARTIAAANYATASALATVAGYIDTEVASILAAVDTEVAAIKAKTDSLPASPAATGDAMTLSSAYDFAKGNVAMTEAYRATNATGTPIQVLYEILQNITEFSLSGTTKTTKMLNGSSTAKTYTLNSSTAPSSITEET